MEWLDFLKYGAIGISLALAILSYRLLAKEQEKADVRIPMLNSIRNYFLFALTLSIFFGAIEVFVKVAAQKDSKAENALNDIWEEHFSAYDDTLIDQKIKRIKKHFQSGAGIADTSVICADIRVELESCQEKLRSFRYGFYSNITNLKKAVDENPDGWINIDFDAENKKEVYLILESLFISLGEFSSENQTDEAIISKWKSHKASWTADKFEYIFSSDVPELVRIYLNKYYPRAV